MSTYTARRTRTALAGGVTALALVLTGCSDSAGPEAGAVTTEDLQGIEERLGAFDERLGVLEERAGAAVAGGDDAAATEPEIVGQEVTVSAEVSELITSTDAGSAFRIAGDSGPSVAVLATSPPEGLDANTVVRVTGTVQMVQRDSFEEDFGIAEDELFDDPDTFFEEAEGQPAIAATEVEVLQAQAEN
jgi:hypothetical protein